MDTTIGQKFCKAIKCKECKGLYITGTVVVLLIITAWAFVKYFLKLQPEKVDVMNKNIIVLPFVGPISWWPISHLILFFILGAFFPMCAGPAIIGGIVWELFERLMYSFGHDVFALKVMNDGEIQYSTWWNGSFFDIIMNIVGFYLGKWWRLYVLEVAFANR